MGSAAEGLAQKGGRRRGRPPPLRPSIPFRDDATWPSPSRALVETVEGRQACLCRGRTVERAGGLGARESSGEPSSNLPVISLSGHSQAGTESAGGLVVKCLRR
eukprot:361612-Chlamydomonas_euryale.AAC.26